MTYKFPLLLCMDKTNKSNTEWDPDEEMDSLRASLHLSKNRRRWYRSLLDPYTQELTDLAQRGASLSMLCAFLKKHRLTVARSTVSRWLKKNVPDRRLPD